MNKSPIVFALLIAACNGRQGAQFGADAPAQPDGNASHSDASSGATDPASDGAQTVVESTATIPGATSGRQLTSTVYTPQSSGPHALVVVSPGFQMPRTQYATYAHHLATWNYVVVLTDYADSGFTASHQAMADDVTAVIDWAFDQPALAIDKQRVATVGHSLGGKISVFAATQDKRIKAVVGWDPVDSSNPSVAPDKMSGMTAAIAVIGETTDASGGWMPCAPAADNFTAFYAAAPSPSLQMTVEGADHMDWVDDSSCAFCGFCTDGTAPDSRAHDLTRRLDVAWLGRHLFDDASMDAWLGAPTDGSATVTKK